tara:strand:+ start:1506 stop:1790 length:285 start_codon:yes stop_codon:yes gene_type:complete
MNLEIKAPFDVGDRVKPSEYSIRPFRDRWLQAGSSSSKLGCLSHYETQMSVLGTVVSCERGKYGFCVNVKTDSGGMHSSLPDLWEKIPEKEGNK